VKATISDWNSVATSGSATWGIATQCVSAGGIASTSGYGAYTTWTASNANGTASHRDTTNQLSLTTGCSAGDVLYFDIELTTGNNSMSEPANLKWLDLLVTW
jgi:hypothetical protein